MVGVAEFQSCLHCFSRLSNFEQVICLPPEWMHHIQSRIFSVLWSLSEWNWYQVHGRHINKNNLLNECVRELLHLSVFSSVKGGAMIVEYLIELFWGCNQITHDKFLAHRILLLLLLPLSPSSSSCSLLTGGISQGGALPRACVSLGGCVTWDLVPSRDREGSSLLLPNLPSPLGPVWASARAQILFFLQHHLLLPKSLFSTSLKFLEGYEGALAIFVSHAVHAWHRAPGRLCGAAKQICPEEWRGRGQTPARASWGYGNNFHIFPENKDKCGN